MSTMLGNPTWPARTHGVDTCVEDFELQDDPMLAMRQEWLRSGVEGRVLHLIVSVDAAFDEEDGDD